jgi:flagellum-specific peptidoglycan hydrolase FlgJ
MKKFVIVIVSFFYSIATMAQDGISPVQYIEMYKEMAIGEMKRMGVPAAITLAQGILETESGNSDLVKKSNNHFGIKCKSNWTGGSVTHDDDARGECFRLYPTAKDSYRDHSNFLRSNSRYGFLFQLDVRDYKAWANGLKRAGYATNPAYPQILIKFIEQYNLQQYTLIAADEVPVFNTDNYQDDVVEETIVEEKVPDRSSTLDVSDNVISVNGSKCLIAGKGTSLLVIATKNDIGLNKLLSFNELSEDGLLVKNQYIYLQKKSKTGDKDFYVALGGEDLYEIAQKNGIQLQYMLDYNKLWGNEDIKAGTKIYLKPNLYTIAPAKTSVVVKEIKEVKEVTPAKVHIVQAKEGLYAISKKYSVSVQQLKQWNNLQNDALSIGQQLIVSQ